MGAARARSCPTCGSGIPVTRCCGGGRRLVVSFCIRVDGWWSCGFGVLMDGLATTGGTTEGMGGGLRALTMVVRV